MMWPIVISLPHASGCVPESLRPGLALSDAEIMESIDTGTEEVFGALPARHVIRAEWSRLVADLNRGPDERGRNGVIPEVDYSGRAVYLDPPLLNGERFQDRLRRYYWPYHGLLEKKLSQPEFLMLLSREWKRLYPVIWNSTAILFLAVLIVSMELVLITRSKRATF